MSTPLRCINLDWLEVYVLEPNDFYPMNAEWYRKKGYQVREREYGTRVYQEMFEIIDERGNPCVEIRRNPASGDSSFQGLVPQSSHIRLPNWILYQNNPVRFLQNFLLSNGYLFQSIYRIDIAYDFELFDSGDKPEKFVRRYMQGIYRKINQCHLRANGFDAWSQCDWNSLAWGAPASMVSTKLYNKTKELKESKNAKPYIRNSWMIAGLIDDPVNIAKRDEKGKLSPVDIWRVEFSMKSSLKGWITIEKRGRKKIEKTRIPHTLSLFDGKDRLWQRFQDLAHHYFCFKYKEYKDENKALVKTALSKVHSDVERQLKRKDRCRDKVLFDFDKGREFAIASVAPSPSQQSKSSNTFEKLLKEYRLLHFEEKIRNACDILLEDVNLRQLRKYTPHDVFNEAKALQLALSAKMKGDERNVSIIVNDILNYIKSQKLFV